MFSADEYLMSGICLTLLAFGFGKHTGIFVAVSLGMLLVFRAFLKMIAF